MVWISLSIYTSEKCSLACKYCFLKKNPEDADWRTLKAILDWWFKVTGQKTHVHIFGTEPLYRYDLLQNVFDYADLLAKKTKKVLTKGITTNGVGLTKGVAEWLTEHNVSCLCSIDGMREQHNKWRVYPNGSGSWDIVSSNFQRWVKLNPRAEAAFTVTPDSIPKLAENVDAIYKLGFWAVALNKCVDSGPVYTSEDFKALALAFRKVNDLIVRYARRKQKKHIMFISNHTIKRAQNRAHKNVMTSCGAAKGSLATDIHGKIFICHRAVFDYDTFGVGDVWKGLDWRKIEEWRSRRNTHCLRCTMKECSPCYVINLIRNGDVMKTPWEACVYNELIEEASYDLDRQLKREGLYEWYCGPRRKQLIAKREGPADGIKCGPTPIMDEKGRVIGEMTLKKVRK